jgi:hypothetical protein
LKKEHRLKVLENKVLRKIFGPKKDEVTGEWERLHNEELYDMYLPNVIRVIKSRRMKQTTTFVIFNTTGCVERNIYSSLVYSLRTTGCVILHLNSRRMRWAMHVERMERCIQGLGGKPAGKRSV